MRWFQGSISEAIAACKSRRAVFVVFVEGNDETSKNTRATLEDTTISSQLESDDFIVIKLDSGSESYRQFAQIYQLVPIPSLFFIGANGTPLEVVAGEVAVPDLLARIKTVLTKSGKDDQQEAVLPPKQEETPTSSAQSPPPTSSAGTDAEATAPPQQEESNNTVQDDNSVPSTSANSRSNIMEKVERAKELIEKKRQQKQEEEERLERNRELERRRVGQEVQKLKKWQQEQEVKEMREQRRKEKLEEQAARQRVLDQISQDRAERAARMAAESGKDQAEEKREETRVAPSRSDTARIQFRLPDGSSHTNSFPASTPLSEVRSYAASNLNLPFRDFAMSTTFPRREFTAKDHTSTVSELELVPTAVILILPGSSSAVVSSPGYYDVMTGMIWSLLAPLAALFTYLRDWVFRRGNSSGSSNIRPTNSNPSSVPEGRKSQTTRRRATQADSSSTFQRQGNIHRLTTQRDSSDDENNTWNGNSTQQM